MLDVDEDDKLTGEEEFELLAGPLGLSERKIVPEAVQFPDSDPLGASVAMVTATNSMEETLLQIGEDFGHPFNVTSGLTIMSSSVYFVSSDKSVCVCGCVLMFRLSDLGG